MPNMRTHKYTITFVNGATVVSKDVYRTDTETNRTVKTLYILYRLRIDAQP